MAAIHYCWQKIVPTADLRPRRSLNDHSLWMKCMDVASVQMRDLWGTRGFVTACNNPTEMDQVPINNYHTYRPQIGIKVYKKGECKLIFFNLVGLRVHVSLWIWSTVTVWLIGIWRASLLFYPLLKERHSCSASDEPLNMSQEYPEPSAHTTAHLNLAHKLVYPCAVQVHRHGRNTLQASEYNTERKCTSWKTAYLY